MKRSIDGIVLRPGKSEKQLLYCGGILGSHLWRIVFLPSPPVLRQYTMDEILTCEIQSHAWLYPEVVVGMDLLHALVWGAKTGQGGILDPVK